MSALEEGRSVALMEGAKVVLVTEWHELRDPDLFRLKNLMRTPVLLDGRNVWQATDARKAGFTYYGIGRP